MFIILDEKLRSVIYIHNSLIESSENMCLWKETYRYCSKQENILIHYLSESDYENER